jgi:uncharacterized protein YaaR (DUF327 family)
MDNPHTSNQKDGQQPNNNSLRYRVEHLERCFDDIDKLGNELARGQTLREEQIKTIKESIERLDRSHEAYITAQAKLIDIINGKISEINGTLSNKIAEIQSGNSRWFIAILSTVLTSFILIILTQFVHLR